MTLSVASELTVASELARAGPRSGPIKNTAFIQSEHLGRFQGRFAAQREQSQPHDQAAFSTKRCHNA